MTAPVRQSTKVSLLSTSGASFLAEVPTGLGSGDLDLIVALVLSMASGKTVSIPSGYTKIIEDGPSGGVLRIMACWRHAEVTPADATIETDGTNLQRAAALRYRITGHDLTTPIDAVSAALTKDTDNMKDDPPSFTVGGITTATNDALVFATIFLQSSYLLDIGGGERFSVAEPWSLAGLSRSITSNSASNNAAGAIATRTLAASGSTGNCVFGVSANTIKDAAFPWTGGMFAIRSADPGGGPPPAVRRRRNGLLMMM